MKNGLWLSCLIAVLLIATCGRLNPTPTARGTPTITQPTPGLEYPVRTGESLTDQPTVTPFLQESTRIAEDSKTVPALTSSSQPTGHATTTPLPVTGEVQFELLTQQGGMYKGISISGDIAWLGQGPRLVGLNLADPTNPQKISQSEILPGTVKSLLVRDTVAYVMAGRTLVMLDVSNPRSPAVAYQLELPAGDTMALYDDILYVGGVLSLVNQETGYDEGSYLTLLDVSESPRILGTKFLPYLISSIAPVSDDILYVAANGVPGLYAIGTSDPVDLKELRLQGVIGSIYRLQVFGNTLLAAHYNQLVTYDISTPLNLKRLWQQETDKAGQPVGIIYELFAYEGRIYTSGFALAANVIPKQSVFLPPDPLSPSETEISSSLAARNGYLYNAEGNLLTFSTGNPGELELIEEYAAVLGGDVAAMDDRLYVLPAPGSSLYTYQLPDLTAISRFDAQPLGENCCAELYGVMLSDNRVYLTGNYEMRVLSATDLSLLGSLYAEQEPIYPYWRGGRDGDEPVVDGIAYVPAVMSDTNQDTLLLIDWRDPANPQLLGQLPFDPSLRIADSALRDNWLAVSLVSMESDREGSLELYDLSTEELNLIASASFGRDSEPFEVQVGDGYIIVGHGGWHSERGYLRTYSIPDLSLVAEVRTPPIYETELWNDLVLATFRGSPRLLALDLSDAAHPQPVGAFDLAADQAEIATSDSHVIVGNRTMGLYVLRLRRQ